MDMVLYLQMCLGTSDFNPDAKNCQHVRQNFVFVDKIDCTPNKVKVKTLSGMRNFIALKTPDHRVFCKSGGHHACAGSLHDSISFIVNGLLVTLHRR